MAYLGCDEIARNVMIKLTFETTSFIKYSSSKKQFLSFIQWKFNYIAIAFIAQHYLKIVMRLSLGMYQVHCSFFLRTMPTYPVKKVYIWPADINSLPWQRSIYLPFLSKPKEAGPPVIRDPLIVTIPCGALGFFFRQCK